MCRVKFYCTAALTSLSNSVSYITFLFSEWRIFIIILVPSDVMLVTGLFLAFYSYLGFHETSYNMKKIDHMARSILLKLTHRVLKCFTNVLRGIHVA